MTSSVLVYIVTALVCGAGSVGSDVSHVKHTWSREDPEVHMNATQLITSKGFPCENHWVTTKDGYILNLLRIPHGRHNNNNSNKNNKNNSKGSRSVVVLQHGLLGSCTNFLTNLANESLAYILADAGADVWLGNNRGNRYSTNHTHLNPKDDRFWQFSWDEMAKYDLPATIYYILNKSNTDQVYYVGHSQGSIIGFAAFGENVELASHIKHFIAMAPVAQVWNIKSPLRKLAPLAKHYKLFFKMMGTGHFQPVPKMLKFLKFGFCQKWGTLICANILFLGCGFDYKSFNLTRIPVYMSHNPAGTSTANILHWAQEINSRTFQAFDYGSADANTQHYNQSTPPIYDPSKIKIPVAIFRGGKDWLADPADVSWLLPQLNITHDVNIPHYEHLDFIWAFDAPTLIYKDIVNIVFT